MWSKERFSFIRTTTCLIGSAERCAAPIPRVSFTRAPAVNVHAWRAVRNGSLSTVAVGFAVLEAEGLADGVAVGGAVAVDAAVGTAVRVNVDVGATLAVLVRDGRKVGLGSAVL